MSEKERSKLLTNSNPHVSIIVPNYNISSIIKVVSRSIDSIFNMNYRPLEVIIIDNGSTDDSYELLRSMVRNAKPSDVDVKLVKLSRNYGFAGGCVAGFKLVKKRSKYVALVNNDIICEKNSLKKLIEVLESDKNIGAVQGIILKWDGKRIDSAGCYLTQLGNAFSIGTGLEYSSYCSNNISRVFPTSTVATYAVYRKSSLNKIGGLFIPELFLYHEDIELGIRLWRHGFKSVCVPIAVGRHLGSATSKSFSVSDYYSQRNMVSLIVMYDKMWLLNYLIFLPYIFTKAFIKRNAKYIIASIDGVLFGLKLRKKYRKYIKRLEREPRIKLYAIKWYAFLMHLYINHGIKATSLAFVILSMLSLKNYRKNHMFKILMPSGQ